ncbi:aminoacyl-tRNA hydrolase [bacterium]|nr:aminoacyl-tRNA hydrolase [bacterium]
MSYLCGLGNPGNTYTNTRHNLGFQVLDLLAGERNLNWIKLDKRVVAAVWRTGQGEVTLFKPLSYVNLSGIALSAFGGLDRSNLLVICDDINLRTGTIRIRESGGSGGHRGLDSIEKELDSRKFARLRMGIGPAPSSLWKEFVLQPFSELEMPDVIAMRDEALEAIKVTVTRGIKAAMQQFNKKQE